MAKIIETKKISDYEILTDTGWQDLEAVYKTVPYQVWKIKTDDYSLKCADEHIVFKKDLQEVFVKDLKKGDEILTEKGLQKIVSVRKTKKTETMYDVAVNDENHRFYTNGILSHNSTMLTVFSLWMVCFNEDYRAAIVANKETTAINIFKRIRMAYEQLPNYIKPGVKDYGKTGMTLGNDSSIIVSTTTATSIRGDSLNCVDGNTFVSVLNEQGNQNNVKIKNLCSEDLTLNVKKYKILTKSGWSNFHGIKKSLTDKQIRTIETEHFNLKCTEDHLIFTNTGIATQAKNLNVGDLVLCNSGLEKITKITIHGNTNEHVYDILETEDHSFWANGIYVHNCVLLDEAAHIENHLLQDFWASVIPTISSGKKSKILVVSTPNGVGNKFYEIYSGAETKKLKTWKAEKIDWWDVPGRDEEWKQNQVELLGSEEKFSQEFNNTFLDDSAAAVGATVIERFKTQKKDPIWSSEDGEYAVYEQPDKNKLYVVGVDVGEGIGRASSVAQILDVTDLQEIKQVAVYSSNKIEPYHFANKLLTIGHSWGLAPMLIERNNCGAQVIDALYHNHNYEKIVSYSKISEQDKYNKTRNLGVLSHTNVRFDGIQTMRYWVNHLQTVHINDPSTISEFETFVRFPNGTFRKRNDNFFDDRVMALVWALFILTPEICQQYFEIVDYDAQQKPLMIRSNGYWETDLSNYQLKSLNGNNELITSIKVHVEEPSMISKTLGITEKDAMFLDKYDEDLEDLLGQGYEFFQSPDV